MSSRRSTTSIPRAVLRWLTATFVLLSAGLAVISIDAQPPERTPLNTPPEGFTALFNGVDLTNWDDSGKPKGHWIVENGVLKYDGKGESLPTARDYGDFELLVDWKIGPKADSGIYLRGQPQVQIWDRPEIGSGGLFNNQKNPSQPTKVADRPIGEWNTFRILIRGDKVTVFLNGEKVVDNVTMENYSDRSQPLPAAGPILLQHHGDPLEFRNIFIREL